jgi:dGTPase
MKNLRNLLYPNNDGERKVEAKQKPGDGRSPYRRDWARLIHSPCFRRLQGKTQLFPSDEHDFYRNRLTHSLEVAQIASGIAENWNAKEGTFFEKNPIDVDLVYFAGLAHDLGHPPFGHNGEKALDRLMAPFGGFEGNAQTLRILARLEKKETKHYPSVSEEPQPVVDNQDFRHGLNVTYRSLASVLKYDKQIPQAPEDRKDDEKEKPVKGYYFTEAGLVEDIKQNILGAHHDDVKTIECGIMDIADDIAYSTYDLEDSMKAGFISPLKILAFDDDFKLTIVKEVNRQLSKAYRTKAAGQELTLPEFDYIVATSFEKVFSISDNLKTELKVKQGSGTITEGMLSDLAVIASGQAASASASLCNNGYLRGEFTSKLVNDFINAVAIEVDSTYPQLSKVSLDIETFKKVEVLKTISFETIINSPPLKMAERRGMTIIKRIFRTLADEREGRRLLPEDWVDVYFGFKSDELRKRTICDFIASMTDRYCVEFYSRIVGLSPPSIHKPY